MMAKAACSVSTAYISCDDLNALMDEFKNGTPDYYDNLDFAMENAREMIYFITPFYSDSPKYAERLATCHAVLTAVRCAGATKLEEDWPYTLTQPPLAKPWPMELREMLSLTPQMTTNSSCCCDLSRRLGELNAAYDWLQKALPFTKSTPFYDDFWLSMCCLHDMDACILKRMSN